MSNSILLPCLQADREPDFRQHCIEEAMTHVQQTWQACKVAQRQQASVLASLLCDELASLASMVS